jgi:hypothetical protein
MPSRLALGAWSQLRSLQAASRSDRELLHHFVTDRDESAFAALVERYGPLVMRVCRQRLADQHAAEDAFQAVFLVLARKAAAVRPETLGGWLQPAVRRGRSRRPNRWTSSRSGKRWRFSMKSWPGCRPNCGSR